MENAPRVGVVESVEKAVASLERLAAVLRETFPRQRREGSCAVHAAVQVVEEDAKTLHTIVESMASQRVIVLPAEQLMETGIVLYNAARKAFKSFQGTIEDGKAADVEGTRFPVLFLRFMAARVMGLALSCTKSGKSEAGHTRDQSTFVDDCLDVLRSYGRVGSLLLETATKDSTKCLEYLTLAKDALDQSNVIWGRVGLACLTRFKEGVELEEVLQDLWDFCVDRVQAVRLLQSFSSDREVAAPVIIETIHELQMLLPYMSGNGERLLELIRDLVDEWSRCERHVDLVALAEEALRLCDVLESTQDAMEGPFVVSFKRRFLVSLLVSLGYLGDVEKAEACFALLGADRDSASLLLMMKLYLQQNLIEKASITLKHLFQRDDFASSIAGARMFVEACALSDESIQVYRQLERHYGDHVLEIALDLACCLARSKLQQHREHSITELKRIGEEIRNIPSDGRVQAEQTTSRIRQTILDSAQTALNECAYEECQAWADLGIQLSRSPQELAGFKRITAAACLKMGRTSEGWKWANQALQADPSKPSMLSLFEASLQSDEENSESANMLVRDLCEREDFELEDLVAFGYAAHTAGREHVCLMVMEELCSITVERHDSVQGLPFGLLLQNTAQLALRTETAGSRANEDSITSPNSSATIVLKYADMFVQASALQSPAALNEFASQSVFLWFYTTSFNVARSCNRAIMFVKAADIAVQAKRLLGDGCPISKCERECLLAALSLQMMAFDSLDAAHLGDVLALIARIKTLCDNESGHEDFLGRAELAVRLRLYDSDIVALQAMCQSMALKHASNCIEFGDLILQAARYDEAQGVRAKYRELACGMFKHGLQLQLQGDAIDTAQLCYLFRRLIVLAPCKDSLQWFEQLIQLEASVDIKIPPLEAEWFVSKAWNMGVQKHRNRSFDESHKFMKMALAILESVGSSLTDLAKDLHQQYQEVTSLAEVNSMSVD